MRRLTLASDLNLLAKLTRLALDLDRVLEVLFVCGAVEDTTVSRTRVVDRELVQGLARCGLGLGRGGLGLEHACVSRHNVQ